MMSLLNRIVVTQLNPTIPVMTPKGKGYAHLVIDYSQEHDLHWVVFIDNSGECWTFPNSKIRIDTNITLDRNYDNSRSL
jgi:hypothetical protein